MRVFCDASVLIADALPTHVHHAAAHAVLNRIRGGADIGHASGHGLAETFAVLSRMPTRPKLQPEDVLDILENNIIPHIIFVTLEPADYPAAIRDLTMRGYGGGRIYDMLHLYAARKLAVDQIYTFNDDEWKALAPQLADAICAPPTLPQQPSRL